MCMSDVLGKNEKFILPVHVSFYFEASVVDNSHVYILDQQHRLHVRRFPVDGISGSSQRRDTNV